MDRSDRLAHIRGKLSKLPSTPKGWFCLIAGHKWHRRFAGGYLCDRCLLFKWENEMPDRRRR